jgi:2-(1,2-epoxy-1,2-dihydrophenyl)acetyl-CoA isomerase
MSQEMIETIAGGIATITLNRPESRNSLTPAMMRGLAEALPRLAADPAVRVVVLTGAGRAFCAGGDVKSFAARAGGGAAAVESFEDRVNDLRARMEMVRWLHEMPKPTLAVIPGPAAGAGLSMAMACDMRQIPVAGIAAPTAPSRRRGRQFGWVGKPGNPLPLSRASFRPARRP